MTDITELAQSEINDALAQLKQISEYPTPSTQYARVLRKYILALVEALEKARLSIAELEREQEHLRPVGVMSEKAFYRLENSECRFIALWPRPGIFLPRKRPEDGVIVYARTASPQEVKP